MLISALSIPWFAQQTIRKDVTGENFELESPHMMEVRLKGNVWAKRGSMIACHGDIKFQPEGMFERGVGGFFKRVLTGEGGPLTKVSGKGRLYLADKGKQITILRLTNESIVVNCNDVLAFEDTIQHEITPMRRLSGMLVGGLFNVRLAGSGLIAFTTHGHPLTLDVQPGTILRTDPNCTVAWSSCLDPDLKSDLSFKALLGRGGGDFFQMHFNGCGIVVVQPYDEISLRHKS